MQAIKFVQTYEWWWHKSNKSPTITNYKINNVFFFLGFSGKFEAVYYHMRCLQTKTPVETSRQSLVEIFEDIRKRWDVSEKKRMEDRAQRKKDADRLVYWTWKPLDIKGFVSYLNYLISTNHLNLVLLWSIHFCFFKIKWNQIQDFHFLDRILD